MNHAWEYLSVGHLGLGSFPNFLKVCWRVFRYFPTFTIENKPNVGEYTSPMGPSWAKNLWGPFQSNSGLIFVGFHLSLPFRRIRCLCRCLPERTDAWILRD